VGFILWITSSDPIVSSIGLLLGRGALLAFTMVVLLLPAMLVLLDKIIVKSTWKARFFQEEKEENKGATMPKNYNTYNSNNAVYPLFFYAITSKREKRGKC